MSGEGSDWTPIQRKGRRLPLRKVPRDIPAESPFHASLPFTFEIEFNASPSLLRNYVDQRVQFDGRWPEASFQGDAVAWFLHSHLEGSSEVFLPRQYRHSHRDFLF